MARYAIRVHTRSGVKQLEIEARDARDAEVRAAVKGTVIGVKRLRVARVSALSYNDRQVLLSRLSAMLASRVSATEALGLLRDTFHGRVRHVAHELLLKVEAGMSVPEAIVDLGGRDFPETTTAMIQAGANSGATAQALRDAMEFEQRLRQIRKESSKGIWSALMAFMTAIAFVLVTVFVMVPKIMGSALMKMTGGAENFGASLQFAYAVGYAMLGVMVLMVSMFALATLGRALVPRFADGIILRVPVYKDLVLSKAHYIAFYGLSLLVKSGVRMEHAFELLARATGAGALREDFKRARDAVKAGQPWAKAMITLQPTDRAALSASLDRSQVGEAMDAIALSYRDLYAQRVAAVTPALQALAAVGLVLSGLIMFGLTMLPILQMSTRMLR